MRKIISQPVTRMQSVQLLKTQLFRFICVGGCAFVVHWLSVIAIVSHFKISPLIANIIGFSIAFTISYFGHKNWTFMAGNQPLLSSLSKFILVALTGFVINEGCYALLLGMTTVDYRIGLIFALSLASVSTWLLSRHWAFNAK